MCRGIITSQHAIIGRERDVKYETSLNHEKSIPDLQENPQTMEPVIRVWIVLMIIWILGTGKLERHGYPVPGDWNWELERSKCGEAEFASFPSCVRDFLCSSAGKESTCNVEDPSLIPGLGLSPGEGIAYPLQYSWASLMVQLLKNPPALWETWVLSLGWEDSLEKG